MNNTLSQNTFEDFAYVLENSNLAFLCLLLHKCLHLEHLPKSLFLFNVLQLFSAKNNSNIF